LIFSSSSQYEDVRIWAPWGHIAGRWYGNRTERPILALHGWMDNLGTFDRLIPLLPDYLGVLCIDLPGHGRSSRLPPGMHYSVEEYIYIIARVMKEYKWHKVSLMGHSLGGVLSYFFAALAPHMVDMVVQLDIILPPTEFPGIAPMYGIAMEKHLVEEERAEQNEFHEPPSYTLAQMRALLAKGTSNSVPPDLGEHLLYRSVARSQLYPDKFYFSKDGRVKYYTIMPLSLPLAAEFARRIRNKPYLIIKGADSKFISSRSNEALSILRAQNPHLEYHEVPGAHHAHLTHAAECAKYLIPFLRRYRPPPVGSWSLAGEEVAISRKERRKAQERFFSWNLKRRSKL
ncbi:hypothetical protein KR222_000664, partial [Zaprionus bogoriensis]